MLKHSVGDRVSEFLEVGARPYWNVLRSAYFTTQSSSPFPPAV